MGPSEEFNGLYESCNLQQKRFWYHYWIGGCLNRIEAGRMAGWKEPGQSSAQTFHSELGRNLMRLYIEEFGVTAASLMVELHRINMTTLADFEELFTGKKTLKELENDGVDTRQIKKIKCTVNEYTGDHPHTMTTTTLEMYDRSKAIEVQAKILKMFSDGDDGDKMGLEKLLQMLTIAKSSIGTNPEDVEKALNGGADNGSES